MIIAGRPFQLTLYKTEAGTTLVSLQMKDHCSFVYKFNVGPLETCLPPSHKGSLMDIIDSLEVKIQCTEEQKG